MILRQSFVLVVAVSFLAPSKPVSQSIRAGLDWSCLYDIYMVIISIRDIQNSYQLWYIGLHPMILSLIRKTNHKPPVGNGLYMFIPPVMVCYGDDWGMVCYCVAHLNGVYPPLLILHPTAAARKSHVAAWSKRHGSREDFPTPPTRKTKLSASAKWEIEKPQEIRHWILGYTIGILGLWMINIL